MEISWRGSWRGPASPSESRGIIPALTELKGKLRRCYIWAYSLPAAEVIYDVTASRSPKGPQAFLNGFSGHLQANGYPGFRTLFQSGQDPKSIRYVYFGILSLYTVFGITMLCLEPPVTLLFIGTLIMNFALGSTCLHTLVVNTVLLPRPLRPGWFCRISLFMAGLFFLAVATISTWTTLQARGII